MSGRCAASCRAVRFQVILRDVLGSRRARQSRPAFRWLGVTEGVGPMLLLVVGSGWAKSVPVLASPCPLNNALLMD
jgi:hypothetical protein